MSHVPWLHPGQLLWHPSLLSPSPCPLNSPPPASPGQTSGWGWPGSGTLGCSRMRWQNCTAGEGAVEKEEQKKKNFGDVLECYKSEFHTVHFTALLSDTQNFCWAGDKAQAAPPLQLLSCPLAPNDDSLKVQNTNNSFPSIRRNYLGCRSTQQC